MAKEFRKALNFNLDGIASDVELGEEFQAKFDSKYLDYGEGYFDIPTTRLFERSKLDPTKPGHWQFLLSIVADCIHSERTGRRRIWDDSAEDRLFKAVVKQRRADRKNSQRQSIAKVCEQLRKKPEYAKISTETLQARFNIVLRKKRLLARNKDAPPTLRNDLKLFDGN